MVAGTWLNQDGLYLQFGTQKAVPEIAGDFLVYGETREIEHYVGLVPFTFSTGASSIVVPAAPTSFVGTTTAAAAGITSLTTLVPTQTTAVQNTLTGSNLVINQPQLFIESCSVTTLVAAAGGTTLSVGAVVINPTTQVFVQATPNAQVQYINLLPTAQMAVGMTQLFYQPGSTTDSVPASVAGGGSWIGAVPLLTNVITPLPQNAYISAIAAGPYTNGLVKVRIRYNLFGGTYQ